MDYRHDLLVFIFRLFLEGEIQGKGNDVNLNGWSLNRSRKGKCFLRIGILRCCHK
jgi:hypothetical protein